MKPSGLITLTTDFGTADGYVGAVKGSVLSINPAARIVDLSNEIPSYDILVGSFHLGTSFSYFPKGTIHLAVVDPGVGSARRPIVVTTKNHFFVGPDNGLFTLAALRERPTAIYELTEKRYFLDRVSSTFHGRDLFGPVAAHLSCGVPPNRFGKRRQWLKRLPDFSIRSRGTERTGQILFFDKFGNAFTNLHRETLVKNTIKWIVWRRKKIPLYRTYSDIPKDRPGALFGSSGFLELAFREDSFQEQQGAKIGHKVAAKISEHPPGRR